jgi:hypothetical protein
VLHPGKWVTPGWSIVRRDRERFDAYQGLTAGLRAYPEASTAAAYLQAPLSLIHLNEEVSAAGAYSAVETLVWASIPDHDWEKLGAALDAGRLGLTGGDTMHLWASCQLYRHSRHDPAVTRRARNVLSDLGRPALTFAECCWQAAKVLEAYVAAKDLGVL